MDTNNNNTTSVVFDASDKLNAERAQNPRELLTGKIRKAQEKMAECEMLKGDLFAKVANGTLSAESAEEHGRTYDKTLSALSDYVRRIEAKYKRLYAGPDAKKKAETLAQQIADALVARAGKSGDLRGLVGFQFNIAFIPQADGSLAGHTLDVRRYQGQRTADDGDAVNVEELLGL